MDPIFDSLTSWPNPDSVPTDGTASARRKIETKMPQLAV